MRDCSSPVMDARKTTRWEGGQEFCPRMTRIFSERRECEHSDSVCCCFVGREVWPDRSRVCVCRPCVGVCEVTVTSRAPGDPGAEAYAGSQGDRQAERQPSRPSRPAGVYPLLARNVCVLTSTGCVVCAMRATASHPRHMSNTTPPWGPGCPDGPCGGFM